MISHENYDNEYGTKSCKKPYKLPAKVKSIGIYEIKGCIEISLNGEKVFEISVGLEGSNTTIDNK